MKTRVAVVFLSMALLVVAWDVVWNSDRGNRGPKIISPSGNFTAQFQDLPEGSTPAPYGHGVYIRHKRMAFFRRSALVFAGYCQPNMALRWLGERQLLVTCSIAPGAPQPHLLPPPYDIIVRHSSGGS